MVRRLCYDGLVKAKTDVLAREAERQLCCLMNLNHIDYPHCTDRRILVAIVRMGTSDQEQGQTYPAHDYK